MHRSCPLENESAKPAYNIQESEIVGQVARAVPSTYAVPILIDPGSTHSYITPRVVEICAFRRIKHKNSWLSQLAIGTKRKVSEV